VKGEGLRDRVFVRFSCLDFASLDALLETRGALLHKEKRHDAWFAHAPRMDALFDQR
jgi:hypothetical protein